MNNFHIIELIFVAVMLLIIIYALYFSKMSRETREIKKLNIILEEVNKTNDYETAKSRISSIDWKYNKFQVEESKKLIDLVLEAKSVSSDNSTENTSKK